VVHTLNGNYYTQINFNASNDSWDLAPSSTLSSDNYGMFGDGAFTHNTVTIGGTIYGADGGIHANGAFTKVVIEKGASVAGYYGIELMGANSSLTNAGDVLGYYGLYAGGENQKFTNNGVVNGNYYGVYLSYSSDDFVNGEQGKVIAGGFAIIRNGADGEHTKTVNHGIMSGVSYSFASSSADDVLTNDGKMSGNVYTGNGDDTIDTRGGTIVGTITTVGGDDILITDKASHKLVETVSEGTDTVKSTVSYTLSAHVERLFLLGNTDIDGTGTTLADKLHGNSGDNTLKGLGGVDYLFGHKGNDRLFGGAAADWFYFSTGDGDDRILDYVDGTDQIHIEDWAAITSLADLKNNHATNVGADVLIEAGADSLFIKGVHKEDLGAMDVYI